MRNMVMGNSWPSQRRYSNRRLPMACKPHGAAQAATRTDVRRHNSQNVCSYLLHTFAVVSLYTEDAEPPRKQAEATGASV